MPKMTAAQTHLAKLADELDEAIRERLSHYGITPPNLTDHLGTQVLHAMQDEFLIEAYALRIKFRELIAKEGAR